MPLYRAEAAGITRYSPGIHNEAALLQRPEACLEDIYVETPDGRKKRYTEKEARAMWEEGLIPAEALCWKEDSGGWRQATEFFNRGLEQNIVEPPSPRGEEPPVRYRFTKDPEFLTKFLKTMLWIFMGLAVLNLLSDIAQLNLLSSGSFSKARAEANDARQAALGAVYTVTYLVTGVTFLRWIYRANLNCHGFNPGAMRFTPGWSVGSFFIPILNLFRPYQAMKEIWLVSRNPLRWKGQPGAALVGWWWALWLISGVLGQIFFRMTLTARTPAAIKGATSMSIVSDIALIPLTIAAIMLVSSIFRMQEELVESGVTREEP